MFFARAGKCDCFGIIGSDELAARTSLASTLESPSIPKPVPDRVSISRRENNGCIKLSVFSHRINADVSSVNLVIQIVTSPSVQIKKFVGTQKSQ